jgi:hypothetical protein
LAHLGVAVWLADASKFAEYHEWLLSGATVPTAAEAEAQAQSLVGREPLRQALESGKPQQFVAKHIELYQRVGGGLVPKIMFTSAIATGDIGSSDRILQQLGEN